MKTEKKKKYRPDFTHDEKMEIVEKYYLGRVSQVSLAETYKTTQPVISKIIHNFAIENGKSALLMGKHTTNSLSEENKALRKEVLELKKQLYNETMRADFYDTMIDVAEEMFNIQIRKKAGTGQSKGCTKTK
ncbi:MAG: hypothetical protein IKQ77_03960 [Prevotella sp.]|nr:hypothetical protein [Prevotella sp.]